jgi:hypothetical protein
MQEITKADLKTDAQVKDFFEQSARIELSMIKRLYTDSEKRIKYLDKSIMILPKYAIANEYTYNQKTDVWTSPNGRPKATFQLIEDIIKIEQEKEKNK